VNRRDTHTGAELSRLLIAADPSVDPHRLVGLCCELAAGDALTVSLLAPAGDESAARSEGSAPGRCGCWLTPPRCWTRSWSKRRDWRSRFACCTPQRAA
jgi:hypothetical protein